MIPFPFNENRFSFLVVDYLLVGQLCTNPKSDRSLLSCLKVKQCSTSEIGDTPLYNPCSLPIQVMRTGLLPAPSKCKSELPWITGTCPGWRKQHFRLRLWSMVWFQVRATSCHLASSKSAWKSTPKCTWMCWRVWWSLGATSSQVQRDLDLASEGVLRLCTLLWLAPSSPDLNPLDSFVENITNMTSHNTKASRVAAICRAPAGACRKGMLPIPDPYRDGDWG